MKHHPDVVHDDQLGKFEVGTVVRIKKTNEFAIIKEICYLMDRKNFLHYIGVIEGRESTWALYDSDIELECLPSNASLEIIESKKGRL